MRTSYRLQLSFFWVYLRGNQPSVCPALLCNPRRNQVVPTDFSFYSTLPRSAALPGTPVKRPSYSPAMMASLALPAGGYYRRRRSGNIPAPLSISVKMHGFGEHAGDAQQTGQHETNQPSELAVMVPALLVEAIVYPLYRSHQLRPRALNLDVN